MFSAPVGNDRIPSITTATDTALLRVVMAAVEGKRPSVLMLARFSADSLSFAE